MSFLKNFENYLSNNDIDFNHLIIHSRVKNFIPEHYPRYELKFICKRPLDVFGDQNMKFRTYVFSYFNPPAIPSNLSYK